MGDPVSIGLTLALTAAQMGLQASRKIEGPRNDSLDVGLADYGVAWPRVWGLRRIDGLPIPWAKPLTEIQRTSKTKGGKNNNYTYFADFMIGLACHEIAGVTRLWADRHLVLDFTGVGPITPFPIGTTTPDKSKGGSHFTPSSFQDHFRLYLGTEDQLVDPLIRAWAEEKFGEGAATAYRGKAYAVIEQLPVEKFGNRVPQMTAEIAGVIEAAYLTEQLDSNDGLTVASFSADGATMAIITFDAGMVFTTRFEIWDVAGRSLMTSGTTPVLLSRIAGYGAWADGTRLYATYGEHEIYSTIDGSLWSLYFTTGNPIDTVFTLTDGHGNPHWGGTGHDGGGWPSFVFDGLDITAMDLGGAADWRATHFFRDAYGDIWVCGIDATGPARDKVQFHRMVAVGDSLIATNHFEVTMPSSEGVFATIAATHFADDTHNQFVFYFGGAVWIFDILTETLGTSLASASSAEQLQRVFANLVPGATSFWFNIGLAANFKEVSLADLSVLRIINKSLWGFSSASLQQMLYDPTNHALWSQFNTTGDDLDVLYLDRVAGGEVTLQQIVEDVCELAGMDMARVDASALTQVVKGYSVGPGTGKDWLEPLLDLYDVDARPHGFELQFVRRGGSASGTIPYGRLALGSEPGSGPDSGEPVTRTPRTGNSDLPTGVLLRFADPDADQQVNVAVSGPLGDVDSERMLKLDMSSLVLQVDEAKQLAARLHRRQYFDRLSATTALTPQELALEPADRKYVELEDGVASDLRLASMELGADRRIQTEWKRDDASAALLDGSSGAAFDGRRGSTVAVALISKGFALDIPLLSDGDDAGALPSIYFAGGPYSDDGLWPGAVAWHAVGGEYTDQVQDIASSRKAVWGYATDVLGAPGTPWCWDRGNSVTVLLKSGTLTGCTEADIDANPKRNQALLGAPGRWEVVNFTAATLIAPQTWTLSGFKRGRRGSEAASSLHAVGDAFLLLDTAAPSEFGLSDVGTDMSFKVVTRGRELGGAFPNAVAPFTGASLMPYAPANVHAVKQSNGDWIIYGIRRSRLGGAWTSGSSIPLSELTEEYDIDLSDGVTDVTKTTASLPYTWTAAAQASDMGGAVAAGDLSGTIYQISDAVDRGFPAAFAA